jgi:hypothetical protein
MVRAAHTAKDVIKGKGKRGRRRNEPNLTSLCVQGIFQADSGVANSLIGLPKPKSTKSLNDYKTITNNYDLMSGA